ncbi:receptor-like protein 43 [Salvia hispanica]|uniref:receptor-like protein 43 n=1 Tax=Salvia hispanica TaxID=49212 RepID=UPI002009D600|nr:receptor-like protein 43 [Salvia hispanica]
MPITLLQKFFPIILFSTILSLTNIGHSHNLCQDDQKTLLLELKNNLKFNSSVSTKLVKWNQTDDCCEWEGVGCDSAGHVVILQLDSEGIFGGIEDSSSLVSLEKLKLANNSLNGTIPTLNHSSLIELDLSSNQLKGPISNSSLNLQSLEVLSLSYNLFNDTFQLENIYSLHNLTTLNLSHNNLSLDANSNLSRFSHLKKLSLSFCNLHKIPDFLKQSNLNFLDISDNRIAGEIPSWIWEIGNGGLYHLNLSYNLLFDLQKPYHIPDFLSELDLHSNQLRGELPLLPRGASYIDLSSNKFDKPIPLTFVSSNTFMMFLSVANNSISGSIPTSICGSETLRILDLSLNNLSGSIPPCFAEWMSSLEMLDLSRNNISGDIPDKFSTSCRLKFLDVNNNNLGGNFPKSLGNCNSLEMVNVGDNKIEGSFPCMLASRLKVLILYSNLFVGEVSFSSWKKMVLGSKKYKRVLPPDFNYLDSNQGSLSPLLQVVDFSSNNFDGEIPEAIGDLNSLTVLNLSHNSLIGAIPKSFGNMSGLEALDVSLNQLTSTIPVELRQLTFLSVLRVSYNKLVGRIPQGNQFSTFDNDSFVGNAGLCGAPLTISCNGSKS